jgi:hypothetical protein
LPLIDCALVTAGCKGDFESSPPAFFPQSKYQGSLREKQVAFSHAGYRFLSRFAPAFS